jgi:hypothetical protein
MAKFMFVFRGGRMGQLSPSEMQAQTERWREWSRKLVADKKHFGGQPLDNSGKTVRGKDRVVSDGPYAESKDLVTGAMMIEAASLDEATAIALECPIYRYDGAVEVRPVIDFEF